MARTQHHARRHAGFTVTELIVVVSIIALIIALLVPSIAKVRASTRTLRCLTNQRQITQAAYTYATSNAGRWASPRTDEYGWTYPENTSGNAKHCWVKAQGGNVAGAYEKISALEQVHSGFLDVQTLQRRFLPGVKLLEVDGTIDSSVVD